jgi:sialate O-acetylesterase
MPFVHQLFSSNMELQRDASDPIWGWVTPGNTVTVTVQDQNSNVIQTTNPTAGSDGRWQANIGPFGLVTNSAAYTITIASAGQTTVTLTNVLIGDGWLCSGQSNMAFSKKTIGVINSAQEDADSINYTDLRVITVPQVEATTPQTTLTSGFWSVIGPASATNITATGYFTAREIYKRQHIPIGILCSAQGGTEIENWVNLQFALSVSDFVLTYFDQTL